MKSIKRAGLALIGVVVVATVVYAGEGYFMKCAAQKCGYETRLTFGGGMMFDQLTGYCKSCKKFVYLSWTREGGPQMNGAQEPKPRPEPLGQVWDSRTGNTLTLYACPHCKGPFAEIKTKKDLVCCPVCGQEGFDHDASKPRMAID